ncbi:Flagellar hook-associated protein flgK [Pseudomonas sp. OF001]|nr:Flagellar hook-associated protein flgK [Pseudomonas sp. OF001]
MGGRSGARVLMAHPCRLVEGGGRTVPHPPGLPAAALPLVGFPRSYPIRPGTARGASPRRQGAGATRVAAGMPAPRTSVGGMASADGRREPASR